MAEILPGVHVIDGTGTSGRPAGRLEAAGP